jgi:hypothetical protein
MYKFRDSTNLHRVAMNRIFTLLSFSCILAWSLGSVSVNAQTFQSLPMDLAGTYNGRIKWVDLDNDNDLDLLYCGTSYDGTLDFRTLVYENVAGQFIARTTTLPRLWGRALIPGDFDNDGDYDILVTGIGPEPTEWTQYSNTTQLYENRGGFTFVLKQSFYGLTNSTAVWIDLEKDGDLDLIVTGVDDTRDDVPMINETYVYENNGGNFSLLPNTGIGGCGQCFIEPGDSNGDGNLDLLMTGLGPNDFSKTSLYINNGNKTFHEDTSIPILDMTNGDNHWGDFDNDGDLDILICGGVWEPDDTDGVFTGVFENTPTGFIERRDIHLHQFGNAYFAGIIGWADFDNDGFLDIAVSGLDNMYIYRNNQHGNFELLTGSLFENVANGSIDFGDYDNDGDIDIAYLGQSRVNPFDPVAGIYKNMLYDAPATSNTKPLPPASLSLSESAFFRNEVTLHWGQGSDTQTPAAGLGYNFYVRSATKKFTTPPVDHTTGFLRTDNPVSANSTVARIAVDDEGTLYWGVQSVDGGSLGSLFTAEKSFYKFNGPSATGVEIIDPGHVKLSWVNNSRLATSNVISRSLAPSSGYAPLKTVAADVATHIDEYAFATDTYYYYRVHAVDGTHTSPYDSLKVLIPTAPASLAVTSSRAGHVELQWQDLSGYETGYVLERRVTGESTIKVLPTLGASVTTYSDDDVQEGATYVYRIRAINAYGSSAYSNELTVRVNRKPVGKNFSKVLNEDETLLFTESDFVSNFSDNDAGDVLDHIVIQTLPFSGKLYKQESSVTVGQIIPANDLSELSFIPVAEMNGEVSFTILMNDGVDNTREPLRVTLTITPVNDPPVLSAFADVVAQQDKPVELVPFTVSDIDDPVSTLVITASSSDQTLIKNGKVTFSRSAPRFMTIAPEPGKAGSAVLTISVTDGKTTVSRTCNITITPSIVTSVEDIQGTVQVYPNPATTTLTVVAPGVPLQHAAAILLDVSGDEVSRHPVTADGLVVLENLAPGVYLLRIEQDDTLLRQVRIVKH